MDVIRAAVIGTGFIGPAHVEALRRLGVEVVGLAGSSPQRARPKAETLHIPKVYADWRELVADPAVNVVHITSPNYLHYPMAKSAIEAGKHVVCEKPLCMTLEEADEMVETCRKQGVLLMYAEELFFTPKYVRAKQLANEGAFGKVYLVKQSEKHYGPHADWFWDVDRSGGGVFMDMGCHGIAFCYWFYDRSPIKSVYCQMGTYVHGAITRGEDNTLCILEFENGGVALIEDSWARHGGMDDRVEVFGSGGLTYANLHMGNALITYSERGYGYVVEKAPTSQGWTFTTYEELWNYGFPQEMAHFARCVRGKEEPQATGEDGRVVQEVLYAGYESARTGRKVELPFRPQGVKKPIDLWFGEHTEG